MRKYSCNKNKSVKKYQTETRRRLHKFYEGWSSVLNKNAEQCITLGIGCEFGQCDYKDDLTIFSSNGNDGLASGDINNIEDVKEIFQRLKPSLQLCKKNNQKKMALEKEFIDKLLDYHKENIEDAKEIIERLKKDIDKDFFKNKGDNTNLEERIQKMLDSTFLKMGKKIMCIDDKKKFHTEFGYETKAKNDYGSQLIIVYPKSSINEQDSIFQRKSYYIKKWQEDKKTMPENVRIYTLEELGGFDSNTNNNSGRIESENNRIESDNSSIYNEDFIQDFLSKDLKPLSQKVSQHKKIIKRKIKRTQNKYNRKEKKASIVIYNQKPQPEENNISRQNSKLSYLPPRVTPFDMAISNYKDENCLLSDNLLYFNYQDKIVNISTSPPEQTRHVFIF